MDTRTVNVKKMLFCPNIALGTAKPTQQSLTEDSNIQRSAKLQLFRTLCKISRKSCNLFVRTFRSISEPTLGAQLSFRFLLYRQAACSFFFFFFFTLVWNCMMKTYFHSFACKLLSVVWENCKTTFKYDPRDR